MMSLDSSNVSMDGDSGTKIIDDIIKKAAEEHELELKRKFSSSNVSATKIEVPACAPLSGNANDETELPSLGVKAEEDMALSPSGEEAPGYENAFLKFLNTRSVPDSSRPKKLIICNVTSSPQLSSIASTIEKDIEQKSNDIKKLLNFRKEQVTATSTSIKPTHNSEPTNAALVERMMIVNSSKSLERKSRKNTNPKNLRDIIKPSVVEANSPSVFNMQLNTNCYKLVDGKLRLTPGQMPTLSRPDVPKQIVPEDQMPLLDPQENKPKLFYQNSNELLLKPVQQQQQSNASHVGYNYTNLNHIKTIQQPQIIENNTQSLLPANPQNLIWAHKVYSINSCSNSTYENKNRFYPMSLAPISLDEPSVNTHNKTAPTINDNEYILEKTDYETFEKTLKAIDTNKTTSAHTSPVNKCVTPPNVQETNVEDTVPVEEIVSIEESNMENVNKLETKLKTIVIKLNHVTENVVKNEKAVILKKPKRNLPSFKVYEKKVFRKNKSTIERKVLKRARKRLRVIRCRKHVFYRRLNNKQKKPAADLPKLRIKQTRNCYIELRDVFENVSEDVKERLLANQAVSLAELRNDSSSMEEKEQVTPIGTYKELTEAPIIKKSVSFI